jgi:MoaA/NifB/PqqE/SkfB family radical SAM enzyme
LDTQTRKDASVTERNPLPAICDVSVTNVCNAACDFCGFARDKGLAGPRRYIDLSEFRRALPILRRRRIRYMTFQGGEPLVHPEIAALVSSATRAGIECGVITNGWFLPKYIDALASSGLKRLLISLDSDRIFEHERNRGLEGLCGRMAQGIAAARKFGIPTVACVTVNRLVNYEALPELLKKLGFEAVVFSLPRRDPFGSTSLVYSEDSTLVDLGPTEVLAAIASIRRLKKKFHVLNPTVALDEAGRFVRGEKQMFPCIGGHKYFYIDWNLDIWRCEAWSEPMGSVFDLDQIPDQRDVCNACMMSCYRGASAMMHGAIAAMDSSHALARGDVRSALGTLFQRSVASSFWALASERWPRLALSSGNSKVARSAAKMHEASP